MAAEKNHVMATARALAWVLAFGLAWGGCLAPEPFEASEDGFVLPEIDEPDGGPDGVTGDVDEPEDAKPEDAKPEDAKPEDAKPEDAKPEDAKPEDGDVTEDAGPCEGDACPCTASGDCDDQDPCTEDLCADGECTHDSLCQADQVCTAGGCCTPQCDAGSCGSDGCGGACGPCADDEYCDGDEDGGSWQCLTQTCKPETLYCTGDVLATCTASGSGADPDEPEQDCTAGGATQCVDDMGPYGGTDGESGCACVPDCTDKFCGSDGCGSECAPCGAGTYCDVASLPWTCAAQACTPDSTYCDGDTVQTCDPVGAGAVAGQEIWCPDAVTQGVCQEPEAGKAECSCAPDCPADNECGDNGCGDVCGTCVGETYCDLTVCATWVCAPSEATCNGNIATTCNAAGSGYQPGGSNCATQANWGCLDGYCGCISQCEAKLCGDDGCGNSCGTCASNEYCDDGACAEQQCDPQGGMQCNPADMGWVYGCTVDGTWGQKMYDCTSEGGCKDGDCASGGGDSCNVQGDQHCLDSATLEYCNGMTWQTTNCSSMGAGYVCENNNCIPGGGGGCTEGDMVCQPGTNNQAKCVGGGNFELLQNCAEIGDSWICEMGQCKDGAGGPDCSCSGQACGTIEGCFDSCGSCFDADVCFFNLCSSCSDYCNDNPQECGKTTSDEFGVTCACPDCGPVYSEEARAFNQDGGSSEYLVVADDDALSFTSGAMDQSFSVSLWVWTEAIAMGNALPLVHKGGLASPWDYASDGVAAEWGIFIADGAIYLQLYDGWTGYSTHAATDASIPAGDLSQYDGQWMHIVVSHKGGYLGPQGEQDDPHANGNTAFYVNGFEMPMVSEGDPIYLYMTNTTAPLYIGRDHTEDPGIPPGFPGVLDDITIFDEPFDSQQANVAYQQGCPEDLAATSLKPTFVAGWLMGDDPADTIGYLSDVTANGHYATAMGMSPASKAMGVCMQQP